MESSAYKQAAISFKALNDEWKAKPRNLEKIGQILTRLKVELTQLAFLPTDQTNASEKCLLLARDTLEIGAQWSIAKKDIPAFERYIAQLKPYYLDYGKQGDEKTGLLESPYKYQLLGLNLLYLLSQNTVAEFHTELELLPPDQIHNAYIKHPLSIEQYLMEGRYNRIFLAKENVPNPDYSFFMEILLSTVRDEIAACMEKAYERISLPEAVKMLYLSSVEDAKAYGRQRNWNLKSDNFYYFTALDKKKIEDHQLPSKELSEQFMEYARELEMIV
ncbi:26S proteasome non-ATPase regulatory subunit 8 [Neocloeon triangulifer]|uniref:26S proteasome non-ATPase regulatory subunit 8 n=1 Tax=Neocloeon triangulifer TaxID=2078957 RepID=UPI00286F792F|nr:26S proteasome non-ATPase regulatory subunit 8 [Neocloeon triangulifer]